MPMEDDVDEEMEDMSPKQSTRTSMALENGTPTFDPVLPQQLPAVEMTERDGIISPLAQAFHQPPTMIDINVDMPDVEHVEITSDRKGD